MKSTKEYLLEKEWSMGNGQCPECHGCPESWLGHPLYHTSKELGHKVDCPLAQMLKENGVTPLYKGESKLTEEYEGYITEQGLLGKRLKTKDGCPKLKKIEKEWQEEFFDGVYKDIAKLFDKPTYQPEEGEL